jgi:pyruvate/2-oxoglutarate dehydrogenase complex dihydrolipoamide acyltransferase (E2) component
MATPVRMPALAQTSDELRLTAWLKTEGEQVTEGEPLFEAETDKAELEVEATASGTLLRCLAGPGETVSTGTVVAWIGHPGEDIPQAPATVSPSPGVSSRPAPRRRIPPGCPRPRPPARLPVSAVSTWRRSRDLVPADGSNAGTCWPRRTAPDRRAPTTGQPT